MRVKIIVGGAVIIVGIVLGAISFVESSIEYTDFHTAKSMHKKVHVKGEWVKEKGSQFDAAKSRFVFFMRDDSGEEAQVILDGGKPNNFEIATSIVVKGRYQADHFHASEVLTKCPSKYEGNAESVKKTL